MECAVQLADPLDVTLCARRRLVILVLSQTAQLRDAFASDQLAGARCAVRLEQSA